jgi:hypothetical protein
MPGRGRSRRSVSRQTGRGRVNMRYTCVHVRTWTHFLFCDPCTILEGVYCSRKYEWESGHGLVELMTPTISADLDLLLGLLAPEVSHMPKLVSVVVSVFFVAPLLRRDHRLRMKSCREVLGAPPRHTRRSSFHFPYQWSPTPGKGPAIRLEAY